MQIPGPCDRCSRHAVLRTCPLCGDKVCPEHYDVAAGTCTRCAARTRKGTTDPKSEPKKEPGNIPSPPEPRPDVPPEGTGRYS